MINIPVGNYISSSLIFTLPSLINNILPNTIPISYNNSTSLFEFFNTILLLYDFNTSYNIFGMLNVIYNNITNLISDFYIIQYTIL